MLKYCPITGVNIGRFWLSVLVGFGFIAVFNYFMGMHVLADMYAQTPQLWRTPEAIQEHCEYIMLYQFLLVLLTAFLFTRNYEAKGIEEGARFGILLGLIIGLLMGASYLWMPISATLGLASFAWGFLQGVGLGVIYALTYKDSCCATEKTCDSKGADKNKKTGCC